MQDNHPLFQRISQDPVFRQQVIDSFLLSTIDPAGVNQEQKLPWG
jgi:hypothetical protein